MQAPKFWECSGISPSRPGPVRSAKAGLSFPLISLSSHQLRRVRLQRLQSGASKATPPTPFPKFRAPRSVSGTTDPRKRYDSGVGVGCADVSGVGGVSCVLIGGELEPLRDWQKTRAQTCFCGLHSCGWWRRPRRHGSQRAGERQYWSLSPKLACAGGVPQGTLRPGRR